MKESEFRGKVLDYLRCWGMRFETFTKANRTDVMVVLTEGRVLWIEFKRALKKKGTYSLTSGQGLYISYLRGKGHHVVVLAPDINWEGVLEDTINKESNNGDRLA